jgi:hypothetical protein
MVAPASIVVGKPGAVIAGDAGVVARPIAQASQHVHATLWLWHDVGEVQSVIRAGCLGNPFAEEQRIAVSTTGC